MRSTLVLISVFLFSLFSAVANAAPRTWGSIGNWTIKGDASLRSCWADTIYQDGVGMTIVFGDGGLVHWIITNIDTIPSDIYLVQVAASNGTYGTMKAIGLADGRSAAFLDLSMTGVKTLASAKGIKIEGLGGYTLNGSKAAMSETWRCYEMINNL